STIINEIIKDKDLRLQFSVSATTRKPREGEQHGVHYYFLDVDDFRQRIERNEFAEYEEVYEGRYYGTLKSELERIMAAGDNVVLDVDVKGALSVKKLYGRRALSLFIQPPSIETLRERLIGRGTDSMEEIEKRVSKAAYELSFAPRFDTIVVNDVLATAVNDTHRTIVNFLNS
ncbi:MAG: guanylate kinase, partial [Muribaculaceae bacterium]|nr:guanylate kinase [Muribaculaceae bacterium]